ncbi:hypothetical protein C1646_675910 [Rhizophagus diaphanus]|nr:hypothetical protein C1646_675910 [Rhizophagus diaphanus] [Rhizophagus sp. MUCL 43196]
MACPLGRPKMHDLYQLTPHASLSDKPLSTNSLFGSGCFGCSGCWANLPTLRLLGLVSFSIHCASISKKQQNDVTIINKSNMVIDNADELKLGNRLIHALNNQKKKFNLQSSGVCGKLTNNLQRSPINKSLPYGIPSPSGSQERRTNYLKFGRRYKKKKEIIQKYDSLPENKQVNNVQQTFSKQRSEEDEEDEKKDEEEKKDDEKEKEVEETVLLLINKIQES